LTSLLPSGQALKFVAEVAVEQASQRVTSITLSSDMNLRETNGDLAQRVGYVVGAFIYIPKVCFGTSDKQVDQAGAFFVKTFGPDTPVFPRNAKYSMTFGETLYEFMYSARGMILKTQTPKPSGETFCTL